MQKVTTTLVLKISNVFWKKLKLVVEVLYLIHKVQMMMMITTDTITTKYQTSTTNLSYNIEYIV